MLWLSKVPLFLKVTLIFFVGFGFNLSLSTSDWVCEEVVVRWSGFTDAALALELLGVHAPGPPSARALSFWACFLLSRSLAGGDAEDGPNVKDREREDASADPKPVPVRGCDCWSGEAANDGFWVTALLSTPNPLARESKGGVVPVE